MRDRAHSVRTSSESTRTGVLGGFGEIRVVPPGRAGRPQAVSSVAPIALLSGLPASLPANDRRTPSTNSISPNPPRRPQRVIDDAVGVQQVLGAVPNEARVARGERL